ncbi:MAG: outer membrane lipoprotein carrier protein LolA, partial [bacterium]
MKRRSLLILPVFLLITVAFPVSAKPPSGKKIIDRVQNAYEELKTLRCKFRQESSLPLMDDEPAVTEGTMELASDDRFRFETSEMILVCNGRTLWRYNPVGDPPTVIIDTIDDVEPGLIPREILFEFPKKFNVTQVEEGTLSGNRVYILDLVPKEQGLGVKRIKVWVDEEDSLTRRMEFVDEADNLTVFALTDVQKNVEIADARFRLD